MGELFKNAGYATAIYGKWHLGIDPYSLPTAHGFDEFYGIPPDVSWDSATYVDTIQLTHSMNVPPDVLLAEGPLIYEAVAGGPLRKVKPYTMDVRAEIDTNELLPKSIDTPPLAHTVRRTALGHRFPLRPGRYHLFAATSFRMALPSIASANSFFSLPFSSSSAFSRRASDTSSPP